MRYLTAMALVLGLANTGFAGDVAMDFGPESTDPTVRLFLEPNNRYPSPNMLPELMTMESCVSLGTTILGAQHSFWDQGLCIDMIDGNSVHLPIRQR